MESLTDKFGYTATIFLLFGFIIFMSAAIADSKLIQKILLHIASGCAVAMFLCLIAAVWV